MKKELVYRILIGILVIIFGIGAISNLLQTTEVMNSILTLGYPHYFSYILGSAQLLAVIVLLIPKLSRYREWTFIGMTINLLSALVSHFIVEGFSVIILVILFALALVLLAFNLNIKIATNEEKPI